ncbi:MAG: zinc-ribbon domain-containing protein, partial [Chloroflexota bacterium]|nr:zinc-ribbon domain-containing protein [Chloroflexota bacterium]
MYCDKCGKVISLDANFCQYCGSDVDSSATPNLDATILRKINWNLAIMLAAANGLILWLASNVSVNSSDFPYYLLLFSTPCTAVFMIVYLHISSKQIRNNIVVLQLLILILAPFYSSVFGSESSGYLEVMMPHLIVLSWGAIAIGTINLLSYRKNNKYRNFLFLIKSIETMITLGIFGAATIVFSAITISIFSVINITLSDSISRLLVIGTGGAMPVLALAISYIPALSPAKQEFSRGISWLIRIFPPVLLAITLPVLFVYSALIPANFMEALNNREVLITYNIMLFAIMLLLVVCTPVTTNSKQTTTHKVLKYSIIAVAVLTVLIGFYALTAVIYRTLMFGLTINRIAVVGWNVINITLMCIVLIRQARYEKDEWITALQSTFSDGVLPYIVWT